MAVATLLLAFLCPQNVDDPGAGSASAATAAPALQRVDLADGRSVTGTLLKQTAEAVWLDLGFDVLRVPLASIIRRESADGATATVVDEEVFARAELPERSIAEGAAAVEAGVIKIESPAGQGSGFITSRDGYAVTNFHVVDSETEVTVTLYLKSKNGYDLVTVRKVKVVAINPEVDLALIKMDPRPGVTLTPVYLGDSDAMRVGDRVYAIGTPIGLERTVSNGIISVDNRTFNGFTHFQITVPINPGNSGGPLFNLRGEVIGVNSAGYIGLQGLNFAIPSSHVIEFLRKRAAFALDTSRPEYGVHYLPAPRKPKPEADAK
ncbi:MAG TPA: trypsin-like peptidase domain-containing protein [Planctomycetota bacterium]|nr:trypsin-like peptidase domain-containing protein [Planctomycetota bacterium]